MLGCDFESDGRTKAEGQGVWRVIPKKQTENYILDLHSSIHTTNYMLPFQAQGRAEFWQANLIHET
jgi:hypothetical protein